MLMCVSSAFGNATDELLKAAKDKRTTPRMIEKLIKLGADVNAKDNEEYTALMLAVLNNSNPEIVKVLIRAGVDIFAKDSDGKTALDHATSNEIKRIIRNAAK